MFLVIDEDKKEFVLKRLFRTSEPELIHLEAENATRLWTTSPALDCPYLVRFCHTVQDPGDRERFRPGSALVFEYCSRGSLLDFIAMRQQNKSPMLTPCELINISLQLTSGLAALHARKLVHRDVAPRNIFISNDKGLLVFKIGDVGFCKYIEDVKGSVSSQKWSVHDAPELLANKLADFRCDVFSLGAVLFELMTMKGLDALATGPIEQARDREAMRNELKTSSSLQSRYSDQFREVVWKMLAEEMTTRHTTATALHALSLLDCKGTSC